MAQLATPFTCTLLIRQVIRCLIFEGIQIFLRVFLAVFDHFRNLSEIGFI